jgi:predicted RNA binding protein YcfA (HicA-like mRNA interferase family)
MLPHRTLGAYAGDVIQRTERCCVKVRDVLRWLAEDGWVLVRTRGSHQQFRHPVKSGLVTLAGSGNDDLAPGTLNSILKQAGLKTSGQE